MSRACLLLSKLAVAEHFYQPSPTYLRDVQTDVTEDWRHKITIWFDHVGAAFHMESETLSVAVNFLDRYLSAVACTADTFELASLSAMLLASKMQETQPLRLSDVARLSCRKIDAKDVNLMELDMLRVLKWRLHPPTYHTFLNLLLELFDVDATNVAERAFQFAEHTRFHVDFVQYPPSLISVASILCALKSLDYDSAVVHRWLSVVRRCHLGYAMMPDAQRLFYECGAKLLRLDNGGRVDSCDAEVENATRHTPEHTDDRKQAGSPTDVAEIEAFL